MYVVFLLGANEMIYTADGHETGQGTKHKEKKQGVGKPTWKGASEVIR